MEAAHESIEEKSAQVQSTTITQGNDNYEEMEMTTSSSNSNNHVVTLKYRVSNRQHMTAAEQERLSQRVSNSINYLVMKHL